MPAPQKAGPIDQAIVDVRRRDVAQHVIIVGKRLARLNRQYRSLEEQVLLYEGQLIRQALEASDGSVTRAARMLGVTHQGLAFILNGRHKS